MLKKINRISSRKEFGVVKDKGKLYQTPLFGLIWMKEPAFADATAGKLGFIVSKKISKKAVDRNRIKRVLSEAVRKSLEKLPEGFRGIFLVKRSMLGQTMENVEKEWKKTLENLK